MNFRKYLPFENYVIATNLSVEEVKRKLAENVEPRRGFELFRTASYSKPYMGDLYGDTFTISRVINYRNSFLPVITGAITTDFGETKVKIKMRPAIGVIIFMCFWLGVVGLVCLTMVVAAVFSEKTGSLDPVVFIPFAMFVFGCLLFTVPFKIESGISRKFLAKLLEAKEQPVRPPEYV